MRESGLQQVCSVLPQEHRVAHVGIWYRRRIEQRNGDLVRLDQLEHACKKHALELEAALVIRIREDVEDILHDTEEVLLEECVRNLGVGACEVVDDLETHYERR